MGMSSSQARLLTLTARMHDIEYKAQRIEAQKLQMANESRRVYEDYLNALDARKIQYKTMNDNGSITFIDANLNRLENGAVPGWDDDLTSNKTFLLINHDTNELYLTQAFADEYHFEDGQELGYDGTLDDYLTDNDAATDIIDIYGPDYDNPIAWAPVTNGRVEPFVEGNEGTTVYGISGSISPEAVYSEGIYSLSESLTAPVIIPPSETTGTEMSFTPVSGGFNVASTPTTTNSITLPGSYKAIIGTTLSSSCYETTFFSEFISWLGINPNTETVKIAAYIDGEREQAIVYDPEMSNMTYLKSAFLGLETGNIHVNYDNGENNISVSNSSGNLYFVVLNDDDSINEIATNYLYQMFISYQEGSQQPITKTTKLNELMYSFESIDANNRVNMPLITVDDTTYDFTALRGINGINDEADFGNLTIEEYVAAINNKTSGLNLSIDDSSGRLSFDIEGEHTISFSNFSGVESSSNTATKVDINLDALAKNIDLAYQISNGIGENVTSLGTISNLKSILSGKNAKYLARMFNELTIAFNGGDPNDINAIYNKIYEYIIHDDGTTVYGTSGERFESGYDFNVYDSDIGSASYTPAQEGTSSAGRVDLYNSVADVRLLLAEAALNDNTKSPTEYLNGDGAFIKTLSYSEMACFATYYGTPEWGNALTALRTAIGSGNKSDLGTYITKLYNGEDMSDYLHNYGRADDIVETGPISDAVTVASSADDILDKLAYDIYSAHSSEYNSPNDVKAALSSIYSASGTELASISTFCGDSSAWGNIVSQLYNKIKNTGDIDADYINKFNGMSVTYGSGNVVELTSEVVGRTEDTKGKVHMANVEAIKSNLEFALKHAGSSKTAEQIIAGRPDSTLYMINEIVCEYLSSGGENSARFNELLGGSVPASPYSSEEYEYVQDISGTCKATKYAEKVVDQKEVWRKDDNYYRLVNEYNLQQKFKGLKVKIIEEPLASSVDFVSNFLTFDNAYIVEFDKNKQEIYDTSVATNTNLQEVSDEKDLKKAEAKYEADMKRIDMKDRRYDTELAALDNERNAVKQEMETVKTVAKDNVDRTFRLFS